MSSRSLRARSALLTSALAVGALLVSAVTVAPAALADQIDSEGDSLADVGLISLGAICAGETRTASDITLSLRRSQPNTNARFQEGSALALTVTGEDYTTSTGATLPAVPDWWYEAADGALFTLTDEPVITVTVPSGAAAGPRTDTVIYTVAGKRASDGNHLTRTEEIQVSYTVTHCDTTPPVIQHVEDPAGPNGAHGWYTVPVSIDWTVSDSQSAITLTAGCVDSTLADDGIQTFSCTATSAGGTAGPVEVVLRKDATPPTVTPTVSGTLGENGWYVGDVTVSWALDDTTSGIDGATASGCDTVTLTTDAAEASYTCSVKDQAGNFTTVTQPVSRDATKPVLAPTVSGTLGTNGWYTSDVAISWSVTDATSDVDPLQTVGCAPATLTADTASYTSTCEATDNAGNTESDSVTVKRDATLPVVAPQLSGTQVNGWFTSDAGLAWDVSDAMSGLAPYTCAPVTVTSDTTGTPFACTATDLAGNTDTVTVVIKRDTVKPTIGLVVDGTEGDGGWYVGPVDVTWTPADATSGVATTSGCESAGVEDDTTGATFTCTATDEAGHTESRSVTVKLDRTAPGIFGPTRVPADPHGTDPEGLDWFRTAVTYTWTCADATSGPVATTVSDTLDAENADRASAQVASGTCRDRAGNTAGADSEGTNLDLTSPALGVTGPADGTAYDVCATPVEPSFGPTDALSGVASQASSWAGPAPYTLGQWVFSASAEDWATNSAAETRTYPVSSYGSSYSGVLQPVNADGTSRFKLGSTVPVKFRLTCGTTPISTATAALTVRFGDPTADPGVAEAVSTSAATTGNLFRYDAVGQQYIFNLSTKTGYLNPGASQPTAFTQGTWTLSVILGDGVVRNVRIQLVK